MEYIDGQKLREIINIPLNPPSKGDLKNSSRAGLPRSYSPFEGGQGDVLPIDTVITYATQIASGLQATHEKDVTHRDIKSANIMITDKGQVKIMDFGLAKIGGRAQLTKSGMTLGTVAYMSPEQSACRACGYFGQHADLGVRRMREIFRALYMLCCWQNCLQICILIYQLTET